MERDMSSHLDASFSTRGSGQLVNEQVTVSRESRAGGMQQIPHGLSRDGRYSVRPLQNGGGMGRRMQHGSSFAAARIPYEHSVAAPGMDGQDMLPGMGEFSVNVPFFGELNWKQLALGAGVGVAAWLAFTARKRKVRSAKAKVADAMSG